MNQVNTHLDVRRLFKGASVFQALVAVKELQRLAQIEGEWSEKTSNLVCHQDGTCNGLQHQAAITGHRQTAIAVNCVESSTDDLPEDIYAIVAKAAAPLAASKVAKEIIEKYARDLAKNPVMITGYGASLSTIVSGVAEFLVEKGDDAAQAQVIGDAYAEAIEQEAGAVTMLTEAIITRVQLALEEQGRSRISWRTADGFIASTEYLLEEHLNVRVGNFFTRKRGMGKGEVDVRKTAQAMSPNFTHSIDATHLRMVVCACDFDLVTVHDSIGSHPCDYFETARMVREKFALVHTCYNALEDLCNSLGQECPEFPSENDYKAEEALRSTYIFS